MLRLLVCLVCHALAGPLILEPDFQLVSFTPEDGKILTGRQALTAVFSLAVLPLGADFGDGPPPEELVPFVLEGAEVPGKLRWVSSSIARFDPSVDWPTDLQALRVVFNLQLRSVSGKRLRTAPETLHLSTNPLDYWVQEVRSKQLNELTDGRWSYDLEADRFQPKGAFECPSDSRIQVGFSGPVVLERFLKEPSMLQLWNGTSGVGIPVSEIAPCAGEAPKPLFLELGEPPATFELRCLEFSLPVRLSTGGAYTVNMKPGSRYHPFSGPVRQGDHGLKLTGPRPFLFKFLPQRCRDVFFRLYLRHGLKADALHRLHTAISVTAADAEVMQHRLEVAKKATLEMKVLDLQPGREYKVRVRPSVDVLDGLGQPLQGSEVTLKMAQLPGLFLTPESRNPGLWSSSVADRFLPSDLPEFFPLLARRHPPKQLGNVEPTSSMQAFACPISSAEELRDFLTFYFSPEKAASSKHGPCAAKAADRPGVLLASGKDVQFNQIPVEFMRSRLLFLELVCMGQDADMRQCGMRSPGNTARFLNAASFEVTVAFASPREAPYASEEPHALILTAVHDLNDASPRPGLEVTVWEIPSTRWMNGQSVQPPVKRIATEVTDAHGRSATSLPQEMRQPHEYGGKKGYVVSVQDPKSGEILLSDLLRLGRMPPQVESPSAAFAGALRVSIATDRAVYAPGDSLAVLGVVAAVGTICPGGKPGNVCAPSAVRNEPSALLAAEIIWALSRGPDQKEVCTVHLWPVSPFGMFSANISVPANASFGPVPSVSLFWARAATPQVLNSCEEWRRHRIHYRDPVLRSTPFDVLVADPRPPTAFIKFKRFPAFLLPGQPLRVALLLETYTGIPLQNHDVKIEISKTVEDALPLPAPEMSQAEDRGEDRSTEFAKSTNASGLWSQDVMFGPQREVSWIPKLGDELTVKASTRGPTGELLVQSQKLPVRLSPYEVDIRTSAGVGGAEGPLPGQDFTAWVELKAAFPDESWSIATGPDAAKVFLVPVSAEDEKTAPNGGSCMAWVHAQEEKQALTPDRFVDERICQQQISLKSPAACQFRMPAAEKYVLVANVNVHGEAGMELIYGCTFIGQTSRDWRRRPVGSTNVFDRFEVKTEKSSYEIGETIHLEVWNPLFVQSRLLIFWGEQPAVVDVENVTGYRKVSLGTVMDQDCPMRVCQAYVFVCSTEDPSTVLEHVPRSIHYPKASPIWALQEVKFNISRPRNCLKVQVTPQAASTAPGSDIEIEVQVDQRGQAEVAVMVVDKAWLDLRPSKLQDPLKAFEPNEIEARGPTWHVVTSLDGISSGDALRKATKIVRQRLEENPWVGFLSWPISLRRTDQSELDVDDYLERWGQELTEFPHPPMVEEFAYRNAGGPLMMAKGMVAPMALMESAPVPAGAKALVGDDAYDAEAATSGASGATAEGTGKQVVLRKRFAKLVALNRALLEPGVNSWRTRVRLPQDLSTYVIRVVAVSHEEGGFWSWGSAESSVQTSQLVYGKPLLPRILRFMDVCRMGVSVQAVNGDSSRPFLVEAVKVQNLRLLDEASQMITMTSTSAEVRFTFASDISVGPAYVVFNIKDAETKTVLDSVAANIDVEVQQQGFRMASTTTIRADPSQASVRKESIAPLSAVPGSGDMSFSASVGFQAPILAAILELAPRSYEQWQPLGEDILALLLGGLIIRVGYGLEAAHEGLARAISAAEDRLPRQVVPGLGLVNAPPEQRSWRAGEQPDLLLNSLALLTLRAAQALGLVPASWAPLDGGVLLEAALKAVEKQRKDWARCCQRDMTLVSYIGQWHLAMFFLAHPPAQSRQDLQPLWEELLREAIDGPKGSELDMLTRIASAQLRRGLVPAFGADRRAFVTAEALLSRTRVQGPTAYVASAEGSMHSASRWVQSLALWLWSGLPSYAQNTMVPLVATQLLSADRSPWQRSLPPRDLIMVSVSLLAFDSATGSSVEADIPLQIVTQSKTLLNVELRSAPPKLLTVWTAWPWSELPDTLPKSGMDLEIQVGAGSGLAIVSYAMDLIPVKPFLEPQFKGIMVQKIVQKLDTRGRCRGPAVHIAEPGQLLCVTIQITSPDDLNEVEVVDLVPAGLEPLDEALSAAAAVAGEDAGDDNSAFVWGLLLGRSWKRTVRRDFVRWRSAYMWGGTHTLSFNCIANAPGVYSLPSAKAHSVKFPEVMGFSGAASFLVEDTAESPNAVSAPMLQQFRRNVGAAFQVDLGLLGASEGVASMLPVACPQACPAAGSCNLAKGICECASSSGDLLPCEDSTQEPGPGPPGPGPTQKPWRHQEPRMPHLPEGHVEDPEALDASHSQTVVVVLLLAVVAAGVYSYITRMKTPRNFAPPDMELSSEPFASLDEDMTAHVRSPLTVEEGSRQHLGGAGALAATEAAE